MDTADEELRETIRIIWPLQARKMTDLLVPRREVLNKNHLTVGKIYAALMILESWRSTRFGKRKSRFGVRFSKFIYLLKFTYLFIYFCQWLSMNLMHELIERKNSVQYIQS